MKYFILTIIFLSFNIFAFAQKKDTLVNKNKDSIVNSQFAFVNHLISLKMFDEAILEMNSNKYLIKNKDSLMYLKGWTYYLIKSLDSSTTSLLKVGFSNSKFYKSRFFAAYNQIYLRNFNIADSICETIVSQKIDSSIYSLYNFEKAGLNLLKKDYITFEKYYKKIDTNYYFLHNEAIRMPKLEVQLRENKRKSPIVAGVLSAFIPGLGKVYAGKPNEGFSSFIHVGVLAAVTYDLYHKEKKINIYNTLSAIVFTVFYGGNIIGSMSSVNRVYNEKNIEIENQILFDLHIPLRFFFK